MYVDPYGALRRPHGPSGSPSGPNGPRRTAGSTVGPRLIGASPVWAAHNSYWRQLGLLYSRCVLIQDRRIGGIKQCDVQGNSQCSTADICPVSTADISISIHHSASAFSINNQHTIGSATAADLAQEFEAARVSITLEAMLAVSLTYVHVIYKSVRALGHKNK